MPGMEQKPNDAKKGGKMTQWFWILIVLLIVGGIAYLVGMKADKAKAPAPEVPEALMDSAEVKRGPSLSWEFAPAGGDPATGAPLTKVTLVADGEARELGTATGSCSIVDGSGTSWSLSEGEVTGVICYFAGGGEEFGVFYDAGAYVVKKGVIEEGSAEEPGLRGQYEALFTI